ncbi:MAG: AsmA-like C-terminal domain-containing protein [Mariprofundaceae bacterium]
MGWLGLAAPDLDALRPQVRDFLQQRLALESLEMGRLSWRWTGLIWVQAADVRLVARDGVLRYAGGDAAVRLSPWSLLSGRVMPDRVELDGGVLDLRLPHPDASAGFVLPDTAVSLEGVALRWRVGTWHGELASLRLDWDDGRLDLAAQGLRVRGRFDDDGLPARLDLEAETMGWLPGRLRDRLKGQASASFRIERLSARRWRIEAGARGAAAPEARPAALSLAPHLAIPFDELAARGEIGLDAAGVPADVALRRLAWREGESAIEVHGAWRAGRLELNATAPRLALRHVWAWLVPLQDAPEWRDWLARMQAGEARHAQGRLILDWPLAGSAKRPVWEAMRWTVAGEVEGAEIALGTGGEVLREVRGRVSVSDKGLEAGIDHARLPAGMGIATGRMRMDWENLLMRIEGEASADMARVLARLGPPESKAWRWTASTAHASFALRWHPEEETPRAASARIRPVDEWRVRIGNAALSLADGTVAWDAAEGFSMKQMRVAGRRVSGRVSLVARERKGGWALEALDARGRGDFAALAEHFQLPAAGASGMVQARIALDSHWHGKIDLADSGWNNLLGGSKRIGEACAIDFSGRRGGGVPFAAFEVRIDEVRGACGDLTLEGSARLSGEGVRIALERLETPFFRGAVTIFGPASAAAPWEMDVNAETFDRRAAPLDWVGRVREDGKPWVLRARIQRFVWDDAVLGGVMLKLASRKDSVGMLEAARIHVGEVDIADAAAMFALRTDGVIDLRRLRARMARQSLEMSALLSPRKEGGMDWRGFALIEGDFGHLMKWAGLSDRFVDGRGHLLFSGRGVAMRARSWWDGLDGRLRLSVDDGRVLEGGPLTKLLAITSLADLPRLLLGRREDLKGEGMVFRRLQMEALIDGPRAAIRNMALRSSAFDMAGRGELRLDERTMDMTMVVRPLQNLDAILAKIPLLRDILGGREHSLYRKIYRMRGPVATAKVEEISAKEAGVAGGGLIETLLGLPGRWFGAAPSGQGEGG